MLACAFAALAWIGRDIELAWALALCAAAALCFDALSAFFHALRTRHGTIVERVARITPPVLVATTSGLLFFPVWRGTDLLFVDQQDNVVHLERARHFLDSLMIHGRWPTWTNLVLGGEPIGDAYGWLGNVLVALVRTLSFGNRDFDLAYARTVALTHAISALAVYSLARRFSRRAVALCVGLLFIVGGQVLGPPGGEWSLWHAFLFMGLWHSLLGASLAVFAVARLIDLARRGAARDAIAAALLLCAAVLAHVFALVVGACVGTCLLVGSLLGPPTLRRRAPKVALALALGLALPAVWLWPTIHVLSTHGLRFGELPRTLDGSLFEFSGPLSTRTLVSTAAASFAALAMRDRLLRAVAIAGLSMVFLNSARFVSELQLTDYGVAYGLQFHRLSLVFQFTGPAAVAACLTAALRFGRRGRAGRAIAWIERTLLYALLALGLLPTLALAIAHGQRQLVGIQAVRVDDPASLRALGQALSRIVRADPNPGRVHWSTPRNAFAAIAVALHYAVPIVVDAHPSGMFLRHRPVAGLPSQNAWGVRWAVATTPMGPPWTLVENIAGYAIYRNGDAEGLAHVSPPAHASVTAFTDREIRVRVDGAPASGTDVQLRVAYYPRFRAWQNGTPLLVRAAPSLPGGPPDQLLVHASNGELVLRPDGLLPRTLPGLLASLASALALLAWTFQARLRTHVGPHLARLTATRVRVRAALASVTPVLRLHAPWIAVAALAAAVLALLLPSAPGTRLRLRAFGFDRSAITRRDASGDSVCIQDLFSRHWQCDQSLDAAISTAEDPPVYFWYGGQPWAALRVEERTGNATTFVRFTRLLARTYVHVHLAPTAGAVPDLALRIGGGAWQTVPVVHGWSSISVPDDQRSRIVDIVARLRFATSGTLHLAGHTDDLPSAPPLARD